MRVLVLSDLHLEFRGLQPAYVCHACGERYRHGEWTDGSTWHQGRCDICGMDETGVTAPDGCGCLRSDWDLALPDPDRYDLVILAGDIHSHTHAIPWAARTFSKPVIYVPGNHEFYDSHLHGMSVQLHQCAQEHPQVHLLDNSSVVVDGVRFVGAVLWTDFMLFGNSMDMIGRCLREAKLHMRDFSTIRFGSTGWMLPADSVKLFRVSAMYLREELGKQFDGPTVVVTHHLPSMNSVADRFRKDLLSAAFASNLDHLVAKADLWVHGHTHDSFDYRIEQCRVVCNPRGYPERLKNQYENPSFDPVKIVEIDASAPNRRSRS